MFALNACPEIHFLFFKLPLKHVLFYNWIFLTLYVAHKTNYGPRVYSFLLFVKALLFVEQVAFANSNVEYILLYL